MPTSMLQNSVVSTCLLYGFELDIASEEYGIKLDLKYEPGRNFFIRIHSSDLEGKVLPPVFTNVLKKKQNVIECQTVELMKRNQKINISHQEVVLMST